MASSGRLPFVPSSIPADLRQFLSRLHDILGATGADKLLTPADLASAGLVTIDNKGTMTPMTVGATTGSVADEATARAAADAALTTALSAETAARTAATAAETVAREAADADEAAARIAGDAAIAAEVLTKAPLYESSVTAASVAGTVTLDASGASQLTLTLTENVTAWAITLPPTTGTCRDLYIDVVQDNTTAYTVVSPASAGRTAGGAWTMTATLGAMETLRLRVFADGTVALYPQGVMG